MYNQTSERMVGSVHNYIWAKKRRNITIRTRRLRVNSNCCNCAKQNDKYKNYFLSRLLSPFVPDGIVSTCAEGN